MSDLPRWAKFQQEQVEQVLFRFSRHYWDLEVTRLRVEQAIEQTGKADLLEPALEEIDEIRRGCKSAIDEWSEIWREGKEDGWGVKWEKPQKTQRKRNRK